MAKTFSGDDFKAVALDVDGTITDSVTHKVRPRVKAAIVHLTERGIPVFIVTGRRSKPVFELAVDCGLTGPMVTNNGASIVDSVSHEILQERFAPRSLHDEVFELSERFDLPVAIWAPEATYADRLSVHTDILAAMAGGEPVQRRDVRAVDPDRIYKLNLYGDKERLDEVQPHIEANHPAVRRSADLFFETATPGATKWEGLLYCLDGVDVSAEQTVGVADGENDLDFIAGVGLGVAVENAFPRLKEVADIQIGHVDDDATAIFLEEFFGLEPGQS